MEFILFYPQVIDELVTYDTPAKGAYRQLWRVSESEYEYKFFSSTGYGIDANATFMVSFWFYSVHINVNSIITLKFGTDRPEQTV